MALRLQNGVILVTTKRGTVKKPEISVRLNKGWNMPTRIPEMADAATYCTMINEIDGYNNQAHTYTDEEIQSSEMVPIPGDTLTLTGLAWCLSLFPISIWLIYL